MENSCKFHSLVLFDYAYFKIAWLLIIQASLNANARFRLAFCKSRLHNYPCICEQDALLSLSILNSAASLEGSLDFVLAVKSSREWT